MIYRKKPRVILTFCHSFKIDNVSWNFNSYNLEKDIDKAETFNYPYWRFQYLSSTT